MTVRCGEKEEIQVNEMEPGRRGPGRFLGLIIIYTLEYRVQEVKNKRLVNSKSFLESRFWYCLRWAVNITLMQSLRSVGVRGETFAEETF